MPVKSFKAVISGKRQELEGCERRLNNVMLYLRMHPNDIGAGEMEADLTWAQVFLRRAIRAMSGTPSEK